MRHRLERDAEGQRGLWRMSTTKRAAKEVHTIRRYKRSTRVNPWERRNAIRDGLTRRGQAHSVLRPREARPDAVMVDTVSDHDGRSVLFSCI